MEGVTADQEESLLQQLTEITRVMQEGQLVEGIAPEKKTQEDWDEYEELHPYWEHTHCCCQHSPAAATEEGRAEDDEDEQTGDPPGRVPVAGEAGGAEDLSTSAALTVADSCVTPERGVCEHEEEGDHSDPGFQEDQQAEVPELPLDVTSTSERQPTGVSVPPVGTETSCSAVRQRKRRRGKKAAQ